MSILFDVTTKGKLTFQNRFVRAAVHTATNGGKVDENLLGIFEGLAKGGTGTILTGFTLVSGVEKSFPLLALYDDSFIDGHKQIVDLVHKYKANIISQIVYVGGNAIGPVKHTLLGPSTVPNIRSKLPTKEATIEEIKEIQKNFAATALRAKNVGYDGVEIHAAHLFFLCTFFDSYLNKRTDNYGGSVENRARNALETLAAVRAAVGPDYPIWIKINVTDDPPSPADELKLYDLVAYSKLLAAAGIDGIEISGAYHKYSEKETSYFRTQAAAIADAVADRDVPVILTGGNRDPAELAEILRTTKIRYFGLARPLIKNPNFVNDLKKNLK